MLDCTLNVGEWGSEWRWLREKLPAYASEVHFFEMLHKTLSRAESLRLSALKGVFH